MTVIAALCAAFGFNRNSKLLSISRNPWTAPESPPPQLARPFCRSRRPVLPLPRVPAPAPWTYVLGAPCIVYSSRRSPPSGPPLNFPAIESLAFHNTPAFPVQSPFFTALGGSDCHNSQTIPTPFEGSARTAPRRRIRCVLQLRDGSRVFLHPLRAPAISPQPESTVPATGQWCKRASVLPIASGTFRNVR